MALTEILNRRTKTSKTFDLGNGTKRTRAHSAQKHYEDSAKTLQDIDTTLLPAGGGLYQDKCQYNCQLPALADGVFQFHNGDHDFNVKIVGIKPVGYIPSPDNWGAIGKGIRYTDAFGTGIHWETLATHHGLHKQVRFDQPPSDISKDFIITFELVSKPQFFSYQNNILSSPTSVDITKSQILAGRIKNKIITMSNGLDKSYIRFPKARDSNPDNRKSLPVQIVFYTKLGKTYMQKIIPKEIFQGAVYPIIADDPATYNSGAGDGWMEAGYSADWATVHAVTSASYTDYTSNVPEAGVLSGSPSTNRKILRGAISCDTSAIGTDTISASTMYVYGDSINRNHDNDGEDYISVVEGFQANDLTLVAADWIDIGSDNGTAGRANQTSIVELHASGARIDVGSWGNPGWNSWVMNATGLAFINKSGYTKLGLREGHDLLDHDIVIGGIYQGNVVNWQSSENTNAPYLDVTHAPAGGDVTTTETDALVAINDLTLRVLNKPRIDSLLFSGDQGISKLNKFLVGGSFPLFDKQTKQLSSQQSNNISNLNDLHTKVLTLVQLDDLSSFVDAFSAVSAQLTLKILQDSLVSLQDLTKKIQCSFYTDSLVSLQDDYVSLVAGIILKVLQDSLIDLVDQSRKQKYAIWGESLSNLSDEFVKGVLRQALSSDVLVSLEDSKYKINTKTISEILLNAQDQITSLQSKTQDDFIVSINEEVSKQLFSIIPQELSSLSDIYSADVTVWAGIITSLLTDSLINFSDRLTKDLYSVTKDDLSLFADVYSTEAIALAVLFLLTDIKDYIGKTSSIKDYIGKESDIKGH